MMNDILKNKLDNLPTTPGVYQFKDEKNVVIYVGKAKNLKNRVKSYFNHQKYDSPKTRVLVEKVCDLEMIITDTEVEALVLENNLIKELKPRYNINLKDDKSFPYIRVTNEPFPQIYSTRNVIRDGSRYFGPFTDVKNMRASLRMINKLFKIRSCKYYLDDDVIRNKKIKLCLDYHIKKCDGPCEGLISQADYNSVVDSVVKLLKGKSAELIHDYQQKMKAAAAEMKFEAAAQFRDKIEQLRLYSEKQKVVTTDFGDKDIISLAVEGKDTACSILNIRGGKLLSKKEFRLSAESDENIRNIYSSVLRFYYNEFVDIPSDIILEQKPEDADTLLEWLHSKTDRRVRFIVPQRTSEALKLLSMCRRNANLLLKEIQLQKMKKDGGVPHVLQSLKRDLHLRKIPLRIECFDISNLQGTDTVASLVVFVDGKPKKSLYRKFIINSVDGPDDFASMREVIERRYSRLVKENEPFPDLIMVDGGKGQLSSAVEILKRLQVTNQDIIGLAKRLEEVFLPGLPEAQTIPKTSSSLKLLQHLRDEAHRFAITFHRHRRSKRTFTTELTEIKGIGEKAAEKLLIKFESVEAIKNADVDKLAEVVGKSKAEAIKTFYLK